MSSVPEREPKRAGMRKRFEDSPAGVSSAGAPAVVTPPTPPNAAVQPESPPAPDIPDQTMSGGLVVPGENVENVVGPSRPHGVGGTPAPLCDPVISVPSLRSAAQNTLSGGLPYDDRAQTLQPFVPSGADVPDHTLTGGLGNAVAARGDHRDVFQQLRAMQPRGKKFDDIPHAVQVSSANATASAIRQRMRFETPEPEATVWKVGDTIEGKYDVTAIAGQGGMGVVYKVHHREWNIDMAVKTPLPALVRDAAAKARFLREAQIWVDLGLHPNLVQCWYVRELGGLPRVFVDYLAGGSLKDWFVKGRVGPGSWSAIIDLMVQACDGLGYAHERGVVHRDIKPGNMLMSEDGRLCITDFGLVKLAGVEDIESGEGVPPSRMAETAMPLSAELTRTGLSLGTPQYGAPEQWGKARHVDARADIYALGVTLFELCAGRRPFDESGKGEPAQIIIARHLTTRPPDPRTFCPDIPAPLAELALKCLAKNPADRPQTLADVRQILADAHEIALGAPLERLAPEIAESRASGMNNRAVSMWDLGQPAQAEAAWTEALELDPRHAESIYNRSLVEFRAGKITDYEAEQRLREAAKSQRKALLFLGHLLLETCDAEGAEKALAEALADPALAADGVAWRALGHARLALERYRDAESAYKQALAIMPGDEAAVAGAARARRSDRVVNGRRAYPNINCARAVEDRIGSVRTVAVAPDGRSLFSDGALNSVCQFELPTGRQLNNFRGHTKQVLCVAPTFDGRHLVCGGEDSTLRMWSLESGFMIDDFYGKGHIGSINTLAISPDSTAAVTGGSDKSVRLWELNKGTQIRTLWAHEEAVFAVAYAPGGEAVVSGGGDATIRIWEMPTGNQVVVLQDGLTPVRALAFSPDGKYLYSGGVDGKIFKWNRATSATEFKGHRATVNSLAVVPGGRFLISGSDDNTVRIWETSSGRCLRTMKGHQGAVNSVAVTPDGTMAVSGASENLGQPLRLWNLELERFTRSSHVADPYAGALYVCRVESQDTSQLASRQFKAHLNDALNAFEGALYAAAYSALKKARKVEGYERDPRALELNARLAQKLPLKGVAAAYLQKEIDGRHPAGIRSIVFAGQGARALTAGRNDKAIGLWDLSTGAFTRTLDGHKQSVEGVALTPDGNTLVSASFDFTVGVWDAATGVLKQTLQGHRGEVNAIAVSKDGRLAASASSDASIKLWDIATGRNVKTFERENAAEAFTAVKFMPDGRAFLAGARDGMVALWSTVTGKITREFPGHSGAIQDIAILPDKTQFLTAGEDKTLRCWNVENGQNLWIAKDGKSRFHAIAASPDGKFIFSAGLEGPNSQVKIWETASGKQLHALCPHTKGIAALALSPDGRQMLTGSEDRFLRVWEIEWELLSNDPLSALSGQFRKPPMPSGIMPVSGTMKREPRPPASGEFHRGPAEDPKRSRPSIFIEKKK